MQGSAACAKLKAAELSFSRLGETPLGCLAEAIANQDDCECSRPDERLLELINEGGGVEMTEPISPARQ
jgi:hypothetical protein